VIRETRMPSKTLLDRIEEGARKRAKKRRPRAKPDKDAPAVFQKGLRLNPNHWLSKSAQALALVTAIWLATKKVGDKALADAIYFNTYKYINRNRCTEYSALTQNQKTAFGEFIQKVLTDLFDWRENDTGPDVKIALVLNGRLQFYDMDIKLSSNARNKGKKKRAKGSMPDQWQISRECYGRINFLVSIDTYRNNFSIGMLDCSQEGFLSKLKKPKKNQVLGGPQRDGKRSITPLGRKNIVWIKYKMPMKPNPLRTRKNILRDYWERCEREFEEIICGETDRQINNRMKKDSITS
jgi:hypothetical protein